VVEDADVVERAIEMAKMALVAIAGAFRESRVLAAPTRWIPDGLDFELVE
jgi:hypothetical protein